MAHPVAKTRFPHSLQMFQHTKTRANSQYRRAKENPPPPVPQRNKGHFSWLSSKLKDHNADKDKGKEKPKEKEKEKEREGSTSPELVESPKLVEKTDEKSKTKSKVRAKLTRQATESALVKKHPEKYATMTPTTLSKSPSDNEIGKKGHRRSYSLENKDDVQTNTQQNNDNTIVENTTTNISRNNSGSLQNSPNLQNSTTNISRNNSGNLQNSPNLQNNNNNTTIISRNNSGNLQNNTTTLLQQQHTTNTSPPSSPKILRRGEKSEPIHASPKVLSRTTSVKLPVYSEYNTNTTTILNSPNNNNSHYTNEFTVHLEKLDPTNNHTTNQTTTTPKLNKSIDTLIITFAASPLESPRETSPRVNSDQRSVSVSSGIGSGSGVHYISGPIISPRSQPTPTTPQPTSKKSKIKYNEFEVKMAGLKRENVELVKMNRELLIKCKELMKA